MTSFFKTILWASSAVIFFALAPVQAQPMASPSGGDDQQNTATAPDASRSETFRQDDPSEENDEGNLDGCPFGKEAMSEQQIG